MQLLAWASREPGPGEVVDSSLKLWRPLRHPVAGVLVVVWIGLAMSAHATAWVGANWGGADLVVANGDTLRGSFTNVNRFVVPAGARVTVVAQTSLAVTAAVVQIDGMLDAAGAGWPGGSGALSANGQGPYGGFGDNSSIQGGGGGGNGGRGGDGDLGRCPQLVPGFAAGGRDPDPLAVEWGSGGGGEWGVGGNGGGTIELVADTIVVGVGGSILADGAIGASNPQGGGGGSGGGAGGVILLDATTTVRVDGDLSARGADGVDGEAGYCDENGGGGGGGGGRILVFGRVFGTLDPQAVAGGVGGGTRPSGHGVGARGQAGTIWIDDLLSALPPALGAVGSCATTVTFTATGGTPYGRALGLSGTGAGNDPLPAGTRCAGRSSGLANPSVLGEGGLDATGGATRAFSVPCGRRVVVVDLWTCAVSASIAVP